MIDLEAEYLAALGDTSPLRRRELQEAGVPQHAIDLAGPAFARVRPVGALLFEPNPDSQVAAFILPVRVDFPDTPESTDPEMAIGSGEIIDLVAFEPQLAARWVLRTGNAEWLGSCPPQYLEPPPVALHLYRFGLVVIDPFVKLHALNENSNPEIDYVCRVLTNLAAQYHCAIDVPHHTSKLLSDTRSNRNRGASSFRDAVRLLYTLTSMTADEAAEMNIDDRERLSLVRLDPGKLNITVPAADATWYKLIGINIGNGNEKHPNGDNVQTVERWIAPDIWKLITIDTTRQILDEFSNGLPDGRKYASGNAGQERQAWRVIQKFAPELTDKQAKIVLNKWEETGMVESVRYTDPTNRKEQKGLVVRRWPG